VIHFSATRTAEEILDIFLRGPRSVSSHYVIDDRGTVTSLVPESKRAWHAGRSVFGGREDVNSRSIGIELRNGGRLTPAGRDNRLFRTVQGLLFHPLNPVVQVGSDWWESYAEPQFTALVHLCRGITERHAIPPDRYVGHSQVATPPGRKIDPGPLFDLERLRSDAGQVA
jgi:N-acetylmuramoyl-L-alanine amidase